MLVCLLINSFHFLFCLKKTISFHSTFNRCMLYIWIMEDRVNFGQCMDLINFIVRVWFFLVGIREYVKLYFVPQMIMFRV